MHPFKAQKREEKGIGKMSDGQIRKVWQLMYSLEKLDIKPSRARLGDRLCGIIKKGTAHRRYTERPFLLAYISTGS